MTTIDEAIHRLSNVKPNVITRDQFGNSVEHLCVVERDDIRTLLSSYDEMKGRIEEAERLMEPFAAKGRAIHPSWSDEYLCEDSLPAGTFRAAASFVSREKVDGGARG